MNKHLTTILSVMLLQACVVHPQYTKPEIKIPESWQAKLQKQTAHAGNVDDLIAWWSQFNDPVLSRLLLLAQEDSPTLDKAIASIKTARASVVTAEAAGIPSVTANASITRAKGGIVSSGATTSSSFSNGITQTSTAKLDASWEIDLFGGIKFSKQAANARLQAKQAEWHNARVSLAAEVANDYVTYRACELALTANQKAVDSKKETARLTEALAKAGFSAPADYALAQASLSASESSMLAQQAQCDGVIKTLVALTNVPEADLRQLINQSNLLPQPQAFDIASVPANLLTQRPDLLSDERNLAAASADIGQAKAELYPSISLTGSVGRRRFDIGGISTNSSTWSIGPAISLPIFDAGQRRAQVSVAEANYEIALATYKQDVRNAVKEVEQALVNLEAANQRVNVEQQSVAQYQAYFKAAEINWRAGGLSLITLEDARRQMINAELSLISQQQNRVQYWIALYKALGGGWTDEAAANTENKTSEMNTEVKEAVK